MAVVCVVSAMQTVRARRGRVVCDGGILTPDQARELAKGLKAAATIADAHSAGRVDLGRAA